MGTGSRLGLALGLLFASMELSVLAVGPYRPGPGSIGWIVVSDVVAALLLSWVGARLGPRDNPVDEAGRAAGLTTLALAAAYVAPGVALLASEGQAGAVLLIAAPVLVAIAASVAARR